MRPTWRRRPSTTASSPAWTRFQLSLRPREAGEAIQGNVQRSWIASSRLPALLAMTSPEVSASAEARRASVMQSASKEPEAAMAITCCIRYKRDAFEEYARRWATIIPRCGGDLIGYFMPHEGTNNIALALISFARVYLRRRRLSGGTDA